MKQKAAVRTWPDVSVYMLVLLVAVVVSLHLLVVYLHIYHPAAISAQIVHWFDMDQEYNFPTLVSSGILALGGAIAVKNFMSALKKIDGLFWLGLSLVLFYFALDEALVIHEQLAEPLRATLKIANTSPFFHAWVLPVLVLVAILGAATLILHMKGLRRLLVYRTIMQYLFFWIVGVVILEILGTKLFTNTSVYRLVMVTSEETFELMMACGMVVLLHNRPIKK